jgi:hypothetical protein
MHRVTVLIMAALGAVLAGLALAQEAADVPLPRDRPGAISSSSALSEVSSSSFSEPSTPNGPPMPRPRPAESSQPSSISSSSEMPSASSSEPSVEEPSAPPREYQVACPAVLNGDVTAKALPPIEENMCGLQSPLSLEAVMANGRSIPLNAPVTTDCGMATALPDWVADVDRWLMATENTRIEQVNVGTNYACRNVNNAKDGDLSFHAFGDALDVIGFTLEDGRTIDVLSAWPGTPEQGSRIIRFAHDAACTHFTTVLGPEANELHRDHLHLDLGCHGQRCTARLCE